MGKTFNEVFIVYNDKFWEFFSHIMNGDILPTCFREIKDVKADHPNVENNCMLVGFVGLEIFL